jgi:phosphate transport system permease protein
MSNTLGNGKNCYFSLCKITITKCSDAGLGRAAGETMLVTLISGNAIGRAAIPTSLFSQSQSNLSQSSLIANEFNEASSDLRLSALIGLGPVLLIITMAINVGARLLVSKTVKVNAGVKE